jgi:hypothetical protein
MIVCSLLRGIWIITRYLLKNSRMTLIHIIQTFFENCDRSFSILVEKLIKNIHHHRKKAVPSSVDYGFVKPDLMVEEALGRIQIVLHSLQALLHAFEVIFCCPNGSQSRQLSFDDRSPFEQLGLLFVEQLQRGLAPSMDF